MAAQVVQDNNAKTSELYSCKIAPSGDLEIHPYLPADKTLRVRISDEAWRERGIDLFASEKVPFGISASRTFAKGIAKLLGEQMKAVGEALPETVHLYEAGAGLCFTAKNILDYIKELYPQFYPRIQLHISDLDQRSFQRIEAGGRFDDHPGKVDFERVDIINPEFTHTPFFIYHSYLADSLPTRQFVVRDGEIFECQVRTVLPERVEIIDYTTTPPTVLSDEEVIDILNGEDAGKRLQIAQQLLPYIKEEIDEIPVQDVEGDFDQPYPSWIKDYVASREAEHEYFAFSFSQALFDSFYRSVDRLDSNGMLFIYDYYSDGVASNPRTRNFGLTHTHSVDFPFLYYFATEMDQGPIGGEAFMNDEVGRVFVYRKSGVDGRNAQSLYLLRFRDSVSSRNESARQIYSEIDNEGQMSEEFFDRMPERLKRDISFGINLINDLITAKKPAAALKFVALYQPCDSGPESLLGYYHAKALENLGRVDEAIDQYREVLNHNPYDSATMRRRAICLLQEERYEEALFQLRDYLPIARDHDRPEMLSHLIATLFALKEHENAVAISDFLTRND